eukprot:13741713-Alexandrium_andersonii.AAC.1
MLAPWWLGCVSRPTPWRPPSSASARSELAGPRLQSAFGTRVILDSAAWPVCVGRALVPKLELALLLLLSCWALG